MVVVEPEIGTPLRVRLTLPTAGVLLMSMANSY